MRARSRGWRDWCEFQCIYNMQRLLIIKIRRKIFHPACICTENIISRIKKPGRIKDPFPFPFAHGNLTLYNGFQSLFRISIYAMLLDGKWFMKRCIHCIYFKPDGFSCQIKCFIGMDEKFFLQIVGLIMVELLLQIVRNWSCAEINPLVKRKIKRPKHLFISNILLPDRVVLHWCLPGICNQDNLYVSC